MTKDMDFEQANAAMTSHSVEGYADAIRAFGITFYKEGCCRKCSRHEICKRFSFLNRTCNFFKAKENMHGGKLE